MTLKLFKKYMITDQKCTYNTFAFVLESNMKIKAQRTNEMVQLTSEL